MARDDLFLREKRLMAREGAAHGFERGAFSRPDAFFLVNSGAFFAPKREGAARTDLPFTPEKPCHGAILRPLKATPLTEGGRATISDPSRERMMSPHAH